MLKVIFRKDLSNYINSVSTYFNNMYELSWFKDDIVKQVVKDIGKSEMDEVV